MFHFKAMRSMLVVVWAAVVANAVATDLPVYCRLLQVGLEEATYQPILADVNLSITENAPLLGDIDVSISHLEIASVKMIACDASLDANGLFKVGFQRMAVDLKELEWRYTQRSWPHTADHGVARGNTSVSFSVSIDMNRDRDHFFGFKLDEIDVTLGAEHHTWLTPALEKAVHFARPLVSTVVQHELNRVIDESLGVVRKHGGCAFLQDMLHEIDLAKLQFVSYEPMKAQVPVLGTLDFSINSTYVTQPTTMQCEHVGFEGQQLTAHIENVPFDAGFNWAYRKPGSSFWHNQGTGVANVVVGGLVHIDLLKPAATQLKIDLPVLKLQLAAQSDAWLYKALTSVLVPLVRESLQLFGGKLMSYKIEQCLEDPTCPKLNSKTSSKTLPAESVSVVV
jgi:hypothetical protein